MRRLHNQNISRGGEAARVGELHLRKLAEQFEAVLDRCVDSAGVEEVHRVRTGSRRLEAALESMLRRGGSRAGALEKAARAWLRQMKKLRRAAAPVRDLDVHRKLLKPAAKRAAAPFRKPAADMAPGRDEAVSPSTPLPPALVPATLTPVAFAEELRALDAWLGGRRRKSSAALVRKIKKRKAVVADCRTAFFAAIEELAGQRIPRSVPAARLALEDFACASDAMPSLNASNLHAFRKRIKKARYIAESGGPEPAAARLAATLKRIQDAIGEWHDWLSLTEEAKTALKGRSSLLAPWLEERRTCALVHALRVARRAGARILSQPESALAGRRGTMRAGPKPPSRASSPAPDSAGINAA